MEELLEVGGVEVVVGGGELVEVLVTIVLGGGGAVVESAVDRGTDGCTSVGEVQRTCWRRLLGRINTLYLTPDPGVHSKDIKAKNMIG